MGENLTKQGYQLTTFDYGLAGAATGFGTRFICQPLDVLKIRLQVSTFLGYFELMNYHKL